jgi:cytidine deaminase
MDEATSQLIEAARAVYGEFGLSEDFSAASVGAAIRTAGGNIYTGVCIDLACGLGFCAEVAAVAEMLKHRETHITAVVAVTDHGILAPCGRCREMMAQVDARNLDCDVIIGEDRMVTLRELLPEHWLANKGETRQSDIP